MEYSDQPNNITLKNKDGIVIPFASSDVKALLTYFLAEYNTVETPYLGQRCNIDLDAYPTQEYSSNSSFISSKIKRLF